MTNTQPLLLVHAGDFAHDHGRVFLFSQDTADRGADLRGTEHRRCDLIKQRLKDVVIRAVDQNVLRRRVAQSLGRSEAAKPAADNHNSWRVGGAWLAAPAEVKFVSFMLWFLV